MSKPGRKARKSTPSPEPSGSAGPPGSRESILSCGRRILDEEGRAILAKRDALAQPFVDLVERLYQLRGKVGITGVGKSGIIGEKIAATLSSTGTPALFLKPVDAVHGDLGVLREDDYLLAISNSGETTEVLTVVHAARSLDVGVACMTGDLASSLAQASDIALSIGVEREACPLGLAPTASTTVTLAVGDAIAMALSELRKLTPEHYARFHPGGSLGQRLRHRVSELMRRDEDVPVVSEDAPLGKALDQMSERGNLGVTLVVNGAGLLVGIVTDGDLRRYLREGLATARKSGDSGHPEAPRVADIMGRRPRVIEAEVSVSEALQLMEVRGITSLAVVDPLSRPVVVADS